MQKKTTKNVRARFKAATLIPFINGSPSNMGVKVSDLTLYEDKVLEYYVPSQGKKTKCFSTLDHYTVQDISNL